MLWRIVELARDVKAISWCGRCVEESLLRIAVKQRQFVTFLICFDIFQSKWYLDALTANTIFGTPINVFRYKIIQIVRVLWLAINHFTFLQYHSIEKCQNRSRMSVFLPWRPTLHTKAHTKSNFSSTPVMLKESLKLNSHWKVSASQKRAESSTSDI